MRLARQLDFLGLLFVLTGVMTGYFGYRSEIFTCLKGPYYRRVLPSVHIFLGLNLRQVYNHFFRLLSNTGGNKLRYGAK